MSFCATLLGMALILLGAAARRRGPSTDLSSTVGLPVCECHGSADRSRPASAARSPGPHLHPTPQQCTLSRMQNRWFTYAKSAPEGPAAV